MYISLSLSPVSSFLTRCCKSCWQIPPTLGRKFFAISPQGLGDGFGLCPEAVVLEMERWPQPPLPRVFTVESVEAAPPPPSSKNIRLVE